MSDHFCLVVWNVFLSFHILGIIIPSFFRWFTYSISDFRSRLLHYQRVAPTSQPRGFTGSSDAKLGVPRGATAWTGGRSPHVKQPQASWYPQVMTNMAMECYGKRPFIDIYSEFSQKNMVIFNGYVKLPEGNMCKSHTTTSTKSPTGLSVFVWKPKIEPSLAKDRWVCIQKDHNLRIIRTCFGPWPP